LEVIKTYGFGTPKTEFLEVEGNAAHFLNHKNFQFWRLKEIRFLNNRKSMIFDVYKTESFETPNRVFGG